MKSFATLPAEITKDTREVTVDVEIRFEKQWSFARRFAGETLSSTRTLMHKNATIYLQQHHDK
ncbi:hypothetical protein Q31b_05500 [Novipirellula aureliae]|uniref:Uncharacterized protein n=1 Tax=Novipirellula aureliae TaxID=2527966 RepID=A0A5C6E968_9BACT|nr:hypothetical protein [Novipirellula aureliae]TWU45378.1 hypothetical protein Q31b_05500 [Novipirellula aureliae]